LQVALKDLGARPDEALRWLEWNYIDIANKTVNISYPENDFYTFRYWRATEGYDRSHKDYDAVMYLLGHSSLRYVLLDKQLSRTRSCRRGEEYIVRETKTKKESKALVEDGFE